MRHSSHQFTYLMLLAMLFWGGGWPALKILTPNAPLEVVTFWRFAIMFFSLIPVLFFLNKPLTLTIKQLFVVIVAAILNILFMVVAFLGVKYGQAGSGGVIITTLSPLLTFLLVAFIFKSRFTLIETLGVFIGLLGGIIMLELVNGNAHQFFQSGNLFYILAAFIWAIVTLLSQKTHTHIHPIHYSFYIASFASGMLFFTASNQNLAIVFDQDLHFWLALLYLGILGQTVATTIYFFASGKLGSAKASSFMFVVPLSALLFSYLLLDEKIKIPILIGGTLSLLAVYIINHTRLKKRS